MMFLEQRDSVHEIQKDLDRAVAQFTALVDNDKATAGALVHHSRTIETLLRRFQARNAGMGGLASL